MRSLSLIAILGTCLTAAAVAGADDRPAGTVPFASAPSIAGYGLAADDAQPKPTAPAPIAPSDGTSDSAANPRPDPLRGRPGGSPVRHRDVVPAVFQEEADSLAVRLAAATEPPAAEVKPDVPAASPAPGPANVLRPPPAMPPSADPRPASGRPGSPAHAPAPPPVLATPRSSGTLATTSTAAVAPSISLGSRADKGPLGKASPLSAAFTVGGSLSIVLGLFLVVAWAMRKAAPRGALLLPKEVFEILGRAPLGARQQAQLLRCGSKLLLVSITPNGTETLTEVTDPLEVDRIAGICQQASPKSSTTAFRQVFQQLATAPAKPSADDDLQLGGARRKRYRWEEKHA